MTRRSEFVRAAREAARIGESERRAQVWRLMAELQSNPSKFDPKRLQSLGRAGLDLFCASIARQEVSAGPADDADLEIEADTGRPPQGWAAERRPELGSLWRAVLSGAGVGAGLVCVPPLLRLFSL